MQFSLLLPVAAGGAVGSVLRYLFGVAALRIAGSGFPWGTLGVNIIGSFVMGALVTALALTGSTSQALRAFLVVGVLGGFTTFSSFSLDFATLMERGQSMPAVLYVAGSVGVSLVAIFAGMSLMRTVLA
jgi:fluoride exporter